MNDNGGDYLFLCRAVRNVIEWIACQNNLPNNLKLPCNLPLPISAFNVDYPLIFNEGTGLYEQPANEAVFKYTIGNRHKLNEVQESMNKISESAVYSPPLLQEPNDGDVIQFYRVGAKLFLSY